jgi:putative ABC transport system permease protein
MINEAALLSTLGVAIGVALTYVMVLAARPLLEKHSGIFVSLTLLSPTEILILVGIVAGAVTMGLFPAFRAYRNTLTDGLQIRV